MKRNKLAKVGAAFATTAALLLAGAGAAQATATIPVPDGHTDIIEIVCNLNANGKPVYDIGSHLSGVGDVPNGTTVLSDYLFTFDRSDSNGWITKSGSTWRVSGNEDAEDDIVFAGFHYEPSSKKCAKTVTIDLKNAPGKSGNVRFTSNPPKPGFVTNGVTSTQNSNKVTLGNPHRWNDPGPKYGDHIHGPWKFVSSGAKTFPVVFDVKPLGGATVTVSTAYLRVQY